MLKTEDYFNAILNNSTANSIILMDKDGIILHVNNAFTQAYGFTNEDVMSKHFRILYTEKDRTLLRPEIEINTTLRTGSSSDENYIMHKDGTPIWVTGEAILVKTETATGIVKIIHNIHAQKQLERYLLASNELLEDLFNSTASALLLLDGRMRTIKANPAFLKLFKCQSPIIQDGKLQDIAHPFWSENEIKNDVRNIITKNETLKKEYILSNEEGKFSKIEIVSKILSDGVDPEKRILLMIKSV